VIPSEGFDSNEEFVKIPTFIFRDRSVAVLESLVEFMKDKRRLSYHEIALMLNRDDRTIWTAYNRTKSKRKNNR
jgi:hypothetical protein